VTKYGCCVRPTYYDRRCTQKVRGSSSYLRLTNTLRSVVLCPGESQSLWTTRQSRETLYRVTGPRVLSCCAQGAPNPSGQCGSRETPTRPGGTRQGTSWGRLPANSVHEVGPRGHPSPPDFTDVSAYGLCSTPAPNGLPPQGAGEIDFHSFYQIRARFFWVPFSISTACPDFCQWVQCNMPLQIAWLNNVAK
jgi:hypothetical protein